MKLCIVLGNRPQFVKAAPLFRELDKQEIDYFVIHSGQHYDFEMSDLFFEQLDLPKPDYFLGVKGGSHGLMTARILEGCERVYQEEQPDCVVVFGDTNTTLAGALAASKMEISVTHVEAGLRSFNRSMPEETNRVLTDHCSDLLFTPTQKATEQLLSEGVAYDKIFQVGDLMFDCSLMMEGMAKAPQSVQITPKQYSLATVHRAANTDRPEPLTEILSALVELSHEEPIIFPVHPRTKNMINRFGLEHLLDEGSVEMIEPVGYLEMLYLIKNARLILSDSGGVPKEAYFLGVPCIILREETEWVELVEDGAAVLAGANRSAIVKIAQELGKTAQNSRKVGSLYGDGEAAKGIVQALISQSKTSLVSLLS